MFKRVLILIILFSLQVRAVETEQSNPYKIMAIVAMHTFDRIKNEQMIINHNPSYLQKIINEEILPYMHVKYAAALVLGPYYKNSTKAQRDNYYKAFRLYVSHITTQMLAMYKGQSFYITPEKPIHEATIVPIRISITDPSGRPPMQLDFQWRKNSITGYWQAYDIIAEGVSIITTKQNEWSHILRQKGINGLTQTLQSYTNQPIKSNKQ
ncbi:Intermembrane phospholipid transport system binding protein MlaC [Candidatus Erwinia haradaeae]|uniref:Intermembrane phospholipid transport system binding protein MlaC n=1 Tax=Candidatus Erwinia haradaeae TaxID=1922217 RepID=A0A451DJ93_9GAMM|nr:phospholipid-binding protein MlaC [Candidatus Erwinia haradaeae]VFP86777.1 Intermembrane phospholipid transport system binding protein MlaC [Candidatus Erwinia haradaeae]